MSTDIKIRKGQFIKIIQSGGFLGPLLGKLDGSLMKFGGPLAKNLLVLLATKKSVSTVDDAIQNHFIYFE